MDYKLPGNTQDHSTKEQREQNAKFEENQKDWEGVHRLERLAERAESEQADAKERLDKASELVESKQTELEKELAKERKLEAEIAETKENEKTENDKRRAEETDVQEKKVEELKQELEQAKKSENDAKETYNEKKEEATVRRDAFDLRERKAASDTKDIYFSQASDRSKIAENAADVLEKISDMLGGAS